jgi:Rap1a immunity proteins
MIRAATVAAALLAVPAWAGEYNGYVLSRLCLDSRGICHGYIVAIADRAVANNIACPPDGVPTTQLVDVVWEFLESLHALEAPLDSAWLDFPAHSLASYALREHWPCKATNGQAGAVR